MHSMFLRDTAVINPPGAMSRRVVVATLTVADSQWINMDSITNVKA
ncbi:hypothetical protein [Brevibacillus sp. IT-7CA2]